MNTTLRIAAPADLAELTAIAHEAKRHWNYPEALIAQWSSTLTIDERCLVEMHVVVADVDGRPEGFCALLPAPGGFQLEHLWVHPRSMGQGLGRELFNCAVDYARSEGAATFMIESDPNAEPFYARMGAVRVGSIPSPVPDDPTRVLPLLEAVLDGEASEPIVPKAPS